MIAAAGNRKNDLLKHIVELARSKLLCKLEINIGHHHLENAAAIAVIDLRLMLDYETRREAARRTEAELVSSHMRIGISVPQTREYFRSCYSSEPLLAEAAAQQMACFRSKDRNATLEILSDNVKSGLLDRGERGELVARELLISAYDRAIEREFNDLKSSRLTDMDSPLYSRGVSLLTFIREIFVPDKAESILDGFPDNVPKGNGMMFREAFKDAKVRFTHFGRMGDDMGTTSPAVRAALIRGMAIVTRVGETLIDLIIPVVLRDSRLTDDVITGILISVKRRREKGTVAKYQIDESSIMFFPPCTDPSSLPYITLIMELGVQLPPPPGATTRIKVRAKSLRKTTKSKKSPASKATSTRKSRVRRASTPSKVKIISPGEIHHYVLRHPRYSFFAYGCSETVYKGITPEQRPIYDFLLASKEFMAEHPRQQNLALSAVRRLKASWTVGPDCYHWLLDDRLLQESAPVYEPDGVIVAEPEITSDDEDLFDAVVESDDAATAEAGPSGSSSHSRRPVPR
jgi:hypothetical protein